MTTRSTAGALPSTPSDHDGRHLGALPRALAASAHPGPAVAVTVLAGLLAVADGHDVRRTALVVSAVLAGQLSIGWSNDLVDRARDRRVGRTDKPLAVGAVSPGVVTASCVLALAVCVPLSLACGPAAGVVHLGCVAAGWAYNLGFKATPWSWLPYALAFGGLTVFVSLAGPAPDLPPWWIPVAAALLGVGAHLVNVLPDLEDDEATGVRGLPHRIGSRRLPAVSTAVLVLASVVVIGGAGAAWPTTAIPVVLVGALAAVAMGGRGRWPFAAAIGIAFVDVVLLVAAA